MAYSRSDYMEERVDHQTYYEAIAEAAGISYANSDWLPKIEKALAAGDEHLNTIPLRSWDDRALFTERVIRQALKAFPGETFSLSVGVCVHKAAARKAANASTATNYFDGPGGLKS